MAHYVLALAGWFSTEDKNEMVQHLAVDLAVAIGQPSGDISAGLQQRMLYPYSDVLGWLRTALQTPQDGATLYQGFLARFPRTPIQYDGFLQIAEALAALNVVLKV